MTWNVICRVRFFFIVAIMLLIQEQCIAVVTTTDAPALIPMPQNITWSGRQFKIPGNESRIIFRIVRNLPEIPLNQDEAYTLDVTPDSVILCATTEKGLFRGKQTIRQLTVTKDGEQFLAGCSIIDWPAFRIRGFMQDVGRNYMSMQMLKEQIDVLAAYKFNVFHFHLTDNPGWRLESRKYPELNSVSSMSRWPGKYYTRQEFQELVSYCNERYITLIPEFDIPGHCEAFRRAFSIDSMSDPRVKQILFGLIDELCELAPEEVMPYIHLGTDEVWTKKERPSEDLIEELIERVKSHQREVIVWRPGQTVKSDNSSITQLWSGNGKPKEGHRYIDSRLNYLNHLDPLAGVAQLYFDRICGAAHGDSLRMGGILCCWNDNNVNNDYDILLQNPVYPGILTYSETSWKGQTADFGDQYLAMLPPAESPLFLEFKNFEGRLAEHRDKYFRDKPFPYVLQTQTVWKIYGPFNDTGSVDLQLTDLQNKKMKMPCLSPVYGGTVHIKHFFGFPSYFSASKGTVYATTRIWSPKKQTTGFWIGFHDWSRSGGRRGGPFPMQGQWHITNPKVWVNGKIVEPPLWKNPGVKADSEEMPFTDEDYFFRQPVMVDLKKGWNDILIKVPQNGLSWKWMFTFIPVCQNGINVSEVRDLRFSITNN